MVPYFKAAYIVLLSKLVGAQNEWIMLCIGGVKNAPVSALMTECKIPTVFSTEIVDP